MKAPGALEVDVLLAVGRHDDEAYGLLVLDEVSEARGRQYSVGAIYTTLSRLEAKGLLSSRTTEPLAMRGGRSRRQYRLTAAARTVLDAERARTMQRWTGETGWAQA
ncbi:PadR family transcriptional regulator [Pengzhenrongella phosphoraccumulans]|uniref:PadR family transcriptional regulator n=1 Tax=Pengzhenrongella phosphoraccumulans TaxID=3114394 RepID=UPI0038900AB0